MKTCSAWAWLVVASRQDGPGASGGHCWPARVRMTLPVVVDDVVADGVPGPVWHLVAVEVPAEQPYGIEAGGAELRRRLLPEGAFLRWRDGLVPRIRRPRESSLVKRCC